MGSTRDLIRHTDAATLLGTSRRHLWRMVRLGHIFPAELSKSKSEPLYRPEDVYALMDARGRGMTMATVANMAYQARAIGRSVDSRLRKLCVFLGIENNQLSTDEDSIYVLHRRAIDTELEDTSTFGSGLIIEWAGIFNAFDEAYLGAVEDFTLDQNPWSVYLKLANKIMAIRSKEADSNLGFAYALMDAARRNLRCTSYFYAVTKHGYRAANKAFIGTDVTEEIIGQLFPYGLDPQ